MNNNENMEVGYFLFLWPAGWQNVLEMCLIYIWFFMPVKLTAQELPQEKTQNRSRLQVELFIGMASVNPADLNRIVDYDNSIQNFTYDTHFDFLRAQNMIRSWIKNTEGERKKIKGTLPVGGRIRYTVLDFLAVSVGFQYMQKKKSEILEFNYTRNEFYDEQNVETLNMSPYEISIKAYNPFVGIHFFKQLNRFLTAEGFVQGGPLFAKCAYESNWQYTWLIQGDGYSWIPFESNGLLEKEGSGTGIALEFGGRLSVPILQGLDMFLEGGYAYQVVKSFSGSGREIQGSNTETWEGEWKTKSETLAAQWGTLDLQFPTNFQTSGTGVEDFWLDLSGFRIKLGISLGF